MSIGVGTIDQLSQIISQVVGPSFLLGAVASFISMLFSRMQVVLDRIRSINAIPQSDDRSVLHEDLPRLKRRLHLLHRSIQLAIASGIVTTLLIITAFAIAFFHSSHIVGSALLFIVSLSFFFASLGVLAREVSISVSDYDHY
jgi:putative exporter of polyketide antibiotics